MSMGTRLSWWLLALSLSFNNLIPAPDQPAPSASANQKSSDETALLTLAEAFFGAWAAKDLDGFLRLWSKRAPDLEAQKKSASELFANCEKIVLRSLALRRVRVEGDRACVRVAADARVIEAKTGGERAGYGQMLRTLECVKEPDGWKVLAELSTYDELANALLSAKTDEERAAVLRVEAELAPTEISRALVRRSERLRDEKQYAQALAAAQLALKLAEQLKDRAAQGLAWEQVGRAYTGQRDYRQAVEYYQRGLALFEALGDKQIASRLLGRIASCYFYVENYQAALENNLKGLKLNEELNDRKSMATTLDDLTLIYYSLGNFPAALATARRAIAVYEELNDDGGIARVLILLGNIQLEQSDYEQAIASYRKAGAIFAKNGDAIGPALATLNIGETYSGMGDYSRALDAYQKALAVFTEQKSLHRMAEAIYRIGTIYSELTDHEQARDYFQRSLLLYEQAKRPLGRAEALAAIGDSYRRQGNYARALDYLRQGLKLLEEAGRKFGLAGALTDMGDLYLQQGDEKLALEFYQRSQTLFEELGSKDKLAALIGRRGMLQQRRGNYEQALAAYEQSLALYKAIGNKRGMAEAHATMGDSYQLLNQQERALICYRESLALFEEIGNNNGVASAMSGIARVEQARNNHAKVLSIAEPAAALAEKTSNLELLWEINSVIGNSRRALKQTELARQAFERAVAAIELLRSHAAGGELARRYFLEHRLTPYHSLIELLVGQGQPLEALVWTERSKARVLLDVIQNGRPNGWVDALRAMTAAEHQQERGLRAEIISFNTQVARLSRQNHPDQARLDELKSLREKARLNYEAFQTLLYAAHPELRVKRGEAPVIKAEELTALLPDERSALLEYVVMDEATYLFAVTQAAERSDADVQVFTLPIQRAELARQVESLRQRLAWRDLGFRDAARRLYDLLLKPARAQLRGKINLVIVPDDKLWELPFQALLADDNRYVLEKSAVSYAPSLTVLREMAKARRRGVETSETSLLAFGNPALGRETVARPALVLGDEKLDPLPEAESEVKGLGRLYGTARSKIYIGAEAREDRAKTEAGDFQVLHFATHGVLNNAAPMYSHLVLAQGDQNEDGLLEAWELMQLDLKADLAVLSACETARGRFGAGEGAIGLTWALFVAGVPTTVVSQWKVESASTRDLMLDFHRRLRIPAKAPVMKAGALRQAALKLMKNQETSHPFYWAGFVLVGDGR
jgi:CHAT domain-containing protein